MSSTAEPSVDVETLVAHRAWVVALARRLVADPHLAEDVAQETLAAAAASPPERRSALPAWLARTVRRRASNVRRGAGRRERHERAAPTPAADRAPDTIVADAEAHRRVVGAVLALDEPYRVTVLLRFYEDVPLPDVARRLGVPYETARARLARALATLRGRLDREHGRAAWAVPLLGRDAAPRGARRPLVVAATVAALVVLGLSLFAWTTRGDAPAQPEGDVAAAPEGPHLVYDDTDDADTGGPRPRVHVATPPEPPAPSASEGDDAEHARPAAPEAPVATAAADGPAERRTVHGTVVDAEGRGLAGVQVAWWEGLGGGDTRSDADGRFEIGLPTGERITAQRVAREVYVRFSAKERATRRVLVFDLEDGARVVLPERTRGDVVVRVLDGTGRPRADVDVLVRARDRSFADLLVQRRTDAAGEVRVHGFPVGEDVEARALEGDAIAALGVARTTRDGAEIELRVDAWRRLHVTVVCDGPSVPVASVEYAPTGDTSFPIRWPGGGTADIDVPSVAQRLRALSGAGAGAWTELSGGTSDVTLPLATQETRAVVLLADERISGGSVTSVLTTPERAPRTVSTPWEQLEETSAGRVLHVRPGDVHTVLYSRDGVLRELVVTDATTSPVDLGADTATAACTVEVVDASGAPVVGARVAPRAARTASPRGAEVATDASGRVVLQLVPGLAYELYVAAPGREGATVPVEMRDGLPVVRVVLADATQCRVRIPGIGRRRIAARGLAASSGLLETRVEDDVVSFAVSKTRWTVLMSELGVWVIEPGVAIGATGDAPDLLHAGRVELRLPAGERCALVEVGAAVPGVHAMGARLGPTAETLLPAGTYVPFDTVDGVFTVYPPVTIGAGAGPVDVTLPDAAELTWTTGSSDGRACMVFARLADADGVMREVPVGSLPAGAPAPWRSAGPELRLVPDER